MTLFNNGLGCREVCANTDTTSTTCFNASLEIRTRRNSPSTNINYRKGEELILREDIAFLWCGGEIERERNTGIWELFVFGKNYFTDQILAIGHDEFTHQQIQHLIWSNVYRSYRIVRQPSTWFRLDIVPNALVSSDDKFEFMRRDLFMSDKLNF